MGGTFDPVHNGHLEAARELLHAAGLKQVWLMPNARPPHRRLPLAGAEDRMRMVEIATSDELGLVPSRLEVDRGGRSYTIDTVRELEQRFPGQPFEIVLGADAAQHIRQWHDADALLKQARFVVFNRPGTTLPEGALAELGLAPPGARTVQLQTPEVAAHEVRERLRQGLRIDHLVPPRVADYIRQHHLYGS